MARTTPTAVIQLMAPGYDYDEVQAPSLEPFIATANELTTAWLAAVAQYRPNWFVSPSDTTSELMERWLSAFFFKLADQQYKTKNSGKSSATFRGNDGEDLKSNTYGRGALGVDAPYKVLAPLYEGRIASTQWLGKPPSEQIPYTDRD